MIEEVVATETESEVTPTDEGQGAQTDDELEKLLNEANSEFDEGTKPKTTETAEADRVAVLESVVSELQNERTTSDIDSAVKVMQGELSDLNLPDIAVRGVLNEIASADPRLRTAFNNHHSSPTTWNAILKAQAKELKSKFSAPVDEQLTSDREGLVAAVKGSTKITEDAPPDFNSMTDAEFNAWKLKQH